MDSKSAKGKKRTVWSDRDTQTLLVLWAERATDLRRAKRNAHIYQEISVQMNKKFSPEEVHVKIRNFTQKYREERKEMGSSGGNPSKWKYFNAVQLIIESTASNSAENTESFSFVNISDTSRQPSPESLSSSESQPLPSPVAVPSAPSLLCPHDATSTPAATSSSSTSRKRNHLGEVIKIMKEQTVILRSVVDDTQTLSNEIVSAIREQNETAKDFVNLMKILINKI